MTPYERMILESACHLYDIAMNVSESLEKEGILIQERDVRNIPEEKVVETSIRIQQTIAKHSTASAMELLTAQDDLMQAVRRFYEHGGIATRTTVQ